MRLLQIFYMTRIIRSSSDAKRKYVRVFNQHSTGLLFRNSLTDQDDEFVDSFGRLKERRVHRTRKFLNVKKQKNDTFLKLRTKPKCKVLPKCIVNVQSKSSFHTSQRELQCHEDLSCVSTLENFQTTRVEK